MDRIVQHTLASLTPAQREAVEHVEGPLLILAGPGSGKTRVVTHRIAYLLHQGIPPRQILALTFTNKAADEMRHRIERMVPGQAVWTGTFHRFAASLLRRYAPLVGLRENFTIYDDEDRRRVIRRILSAVEDSKPLATAEQLAWAIARAKQNVVTPDVYRPASGQPVELAMALVYPLYQKRLLESSAVDFDDLLLHVAVLLRDNPELRSALDDRFRYVLVDEYQDTNRAQYMILRALSADHPNLAATGDPDQSIYGWRGASISNILDFEVHFPQVRIVRLEENWRSTKRILRAAAQLISYNRLRKQKDLTTDNPEGLPVRLACYPTGHQEADDIADRIARDVAGGERQPGDYAVFYRVNALSRSLETALRRRSIPYQVVQGVEFYQRMEIKDLLAYARLANNPRDDVALLRIINTPARSIGKRTIERLVDFAKHHGLTLLDAARAAGRIPELSKRGAEALLRFSALIDSLAPLVPGPVAALLAEVLRATGYRGCFEDTGDEADLNRLGNIDELLSDASQFDRSDHEQRGLEGYLERTALVSDTDALDGSSDRVTLMTLHAAKGLEFPVVFIVALEEGLLPHERSVRDSQSLEEERRLLFVGMTRAQEELQLSYAQRRDRHGDSRLSVASGFLMELPRSELERTVVERLEPDGGTDPFGFPSTSYDTGHTKPRSEESATAQRARPRKSAAAALAGLRTAADLAGQSPTERRCLAPDEFTMGMPVSHPTFGLGKIVQLDGAGKHRRATVAFIQSGTRRFVIAQSPLTPLHAT
jgi:DNA helicase-2/ATP-dependent DNA helicase PcrA